MSENPTTIAERVANQRIIFIKASDPNNPDPRTSEFYRGPRNATLVFAVPKHLNRKIRVAYCRTGGSVNHADLVSLACPNPEEYYVIDGWLAPTDEAFRKPATHTRQVIIKVPRQEDEKELEQLGIDYVNPMQIVNEPLQKQIASQMGAVEVVFQEDPSLVKGLIAASKRIKPAEVGLNHLKWEQQSRSGD